MFQPDDVFLHSLSSIVSGRGSAKFSRASSIPSPFKPPISPDPEGYPIQKTLPILQSFIDPERRECASRSSRRLDDFKQNQRLRHYQEPESQAIVLLHDQPIERPSRMIMGKLATLEPPITRGALSELDVNKIALNPKLRHDINFNLELHFRPNLEGEKRRRKTQRSNEFWETLWVQFRAYIVSREAVEREWGDQEWCLHVEAIRDILETLVPERDRALIDEIISVDLHIQQFRKGVADLEKLAKLAQLLKCHCAPMRDSRIDEIVAQLGDGARNCDVNVLVAGMRSMLGVLEGMKLDVANHQIRCLRPLLFIEDTVHFEQKFFMKKIDVLKGENSHVQSMLATLSPQSSPSPIASCPEHPPRYLLEKISNEYNSHSCAVQILKSLLEISNSGHHNSEKFPSDSSVPVGDRILSKLHGTLPFLELFIDNTGRYFMDPFQQLSALLCKNHPKLVASILTFIYLPIVTALPVDPSASVPRDQNPSEFVQFWKDLWCQFKDHKSGPMFLNSAWGTFLALLYHMITVCDEGAWKDTDLLLGSSYTSSLAAFFLGMGDSLSEWQLALLWLFEACLNLKLLQQKLARFPQMRGKTKFCIIVGGFLSSGVLAQYINPADGRYVNNWIQTAMLAPITTTTITHFWIEFVDKAGVAQSLEDGTYAAPTARLWAQSTLVLQQALFIVAGLEQIPEN
ncbi:hypothetical protein B7463_g11156, partial [Scytalidium lignicola]